MPSKIFPMPETEMLANQEPEQVELVNQFIKKRETNPILHSKESENGDPSLVEFVESGGLSLPYKDQFTLPQKDPVLLQNSPTHKILPNQKWNSDHGSFGAIQEATDAYIQKQNQKMMQNLFANRKYGEDAAIPEARRGLKGDDSVKDGPLGITTKSEKEIGAGLPTAKTFL